MGRAAVIDSDLLVLFLSCLYLSKKKVMFAN